MPSGAERPGWQTTEFWMTFVTALVGLLVGVGIIDPVDTELLNGSADQIIGGAIGVITLVTYIRGRVAVKTGGE